MQTKLCRMNPTSTTTESSNTEQLDNQSSYSINVQSQITNTSTDRLLDNLTCSSFLDTSSIATSTTNNNQAPQLSLPCSSENDQSKANGEFETDLEFGDQFTNSSFNTLLPQQNTVTASLSSLNNNNLLDKVVDNNNKIHLTARSSSYSSSCSPTLTDSSLINRNDLDQLKIDNNQKLSPDLIKLNSSNLLSCSSDMLNKLSVNQFKVEEEDNLFETKLMNDDNDNLTKKLTEKLKEQLAEHLNQQLTKQLQNDHNSSGDDEQSEMDEEEEEDCSEECSSEEEKNDGVLINNKKRLRSLEPHLCSKKRRKQSNPVRCELDRLNLANNQRQQQLSNEMIIDQQQSNLENLENLKNQLNQLNEKRKQQLSEKNQDENEQEEEGLLNKFPNTLSGAANAAARFFLSNHHQQQQSTKNSILDFTNKLSNNNKLGSETGESQINYTYYLAAAAAVATNASLKGTKHCLNYCKECCCPFLSTEHEKLYRQFEDKQNNENTQQQSNEDRSVVFAQQLQNIVQQSKLMGEMESVFGSSYEIGQLPQRNAIDAMQLIKQLGKFKLINQIN